MVDGRKALHALHVLKYEEPLLFESHQVLIKVSLSVLWADPERSLKLVMEAALTVSACRSVATLTNTVSHSKCDEKSTSCLIRPMLLMECHCPLVKMVCTLVLSRLMCQNDRSTIVAEYARPAGQATFARVASRRGTQFAPSAVRL